MKFLIDECFSLKLIELVYQRGYGELFYVVWLGCLGVKDWDFIFFIVIVWCDRYLFQCYGIRLLILVILQLGMWVRVLVSQVWGLMVLSLVVLIRVQVMVVVLLFVLELMKRQFFCLRVMVCMLCLVVLLFNFRMLWLRQGCRWFIWVRVQWMVVVSGDLFEIFVSFMVSYCCRLLKIGVV